MECERSDCSHGFTLIELAIVLVIIGLIIGGVLVGQSLISAGQIRGTISQISKFDAAINTFRLKYGCIPGDCNNAVAFGLGTAGTSSGNGSGNGMVYSYRLFDTGAISCCSSSPEPSSYHTSEIYGAWMHLSAAGLAEGPFTSIALGSLHPSNWDGYMPRTKLSSTSYLVAMTATDTAGGKVWGNGFMLTGRTLFDDSAASFGTPLTALEAYQFDSKLDDGKPGTGTVMTSYPTVGPYLTSSIGCSSASTLEYDSDGSRDFYANPESPKRPDTKECQLFFRGGW